MPSCGSCKLKGFLLMSSIDFGKQSEREKGEGILEKKGGDFRYLKRAEEV